MVSEVCSIFHEVRLCGYSNFRGSNSGTSCDGSNSETNYCIKSSLFYLAGFARRQLKKNDHYVATTLPHRFGFPAAYLCLLRDG